MTGGAERPAIAELVIADDAAAWTELGFAVRDGASHVGSIRLRFAGPVAGEGIVAWSVHGLRSTDLDGLATHLAPEAPPTDHAPAHPNGVLGLDHVVVFTPDLERTNAALERAGLDLRRIREAETPDGPMRQAFFRLHNAVLEVVSGPKVDPGPAWFWGLVAAVADLDAVAARLGDRLGPVRDAVQPGRRIATVRPAAGLGVPLALMTPRPPRAGPPAAERPA
jgi:hypothetical protein